MFRWSSVLLFGAKAKAFFSFWDPERIGLYCNGIVVYGYHNRKGSKPIINTWVNSFLSVIVGFEGVYFCSKIHIIFEQKYTPSNPVYCTEIQKIRLFCRHIPMQGYNLNLHFVHNTLRIRCQMIPLWPVP